MPKLTKDTQLLDIGCGSGDFALAVATHNIKTVVGLDFSVGAFEEAKAKLQASQLNNCTFICADISNLNSNRLFDYIILNDIIEHLADNELITLFTNIIAILSKGGEIIIHTPNGLALCNDTDTNLVQNLFKTYARIFAGWKGHERTIEQMYYDQTHINIKSYSQFNKFIKNLNLKTTVYYDEGNKIPFMSQLSSNMLIVAKKLL
jgi:2-polyprenyl-3-methyl-5-hydroxy-6-metoxy-1,4-benzoquinol methylase